MIFIWLYALVALVCLFANNGEKIKRRKIACVLIFLGIQGIIGLRHIQYGGVDTQVYARDFIRIVTQKYSILDIFRYFYKDFGFYLFAKLISLFSSDMNVWLFICSLPFTIGVTWLIYKYSNNMFLSFIMFLSYGYYLYNFQLVRHLFALGIIIIAYKFLEDEDYKKYFITVGIATFFHTIAILFIGAYFLRKGRVNIKQVIWILIGGCIVIVISQRKVLMAIFSMIPFLSEGRFEQYATRGGGFSSEFIFQVFFIGVSWIFLYWKRQPAKNEIIYSTMKNTMKIESKSARYNLSRQNLTLQFNISVVASLFYLLTTAIGESYRMAQYFSIFTILLVPNALKKAPRDIRLVIELIIIGVGIKHFFGGLFLEGSVYYPYVFFWEKTQSLY